MKKKLLGLVLMLIILCLFAVYVTAAEVLTDDTGEISHFDLNLLQEGGFPCVDYIEKNDTLSIQIQSALYNREENITVNRSDMSCEDFAKIYENVINNSPKLYYVVGEVDIQRLDNNNYIIYPKYKTENDGVSLFAANTMSNAVNEILAQIDSNMSDIEKMLAVHDYMLIHYEYDLTYSIYSAEDFFINKKGVCQAYALAFEYIMEELGIECETIASDSMNHAWNMVEVGGNWYHIDVTWDDPVPDTYGRAYHHYFMLSDTAISDELHGHYDWYSSHKASDETYDSYIFSCVGKPMQYYNGYWYWAQDYGSSNFYDGDKYNWVDAGIGKYSFKDNTVTMISDSYDFITQNIYNGYMYIINRDYELYMAPINNLSESTIFKIAEFNDFDGIENLDGLYLEKGCLYYALTDDEYYELTEELEPVYSDYYNYRYYYFINLKDCKYKTNLCGNNLTWNINSDGVMIISGNGDMWDWSSDNMPWYEYRDTIKYIEIEDGVTSIGDYSFYKYSNLLSVKISDTVLSINQNAFSHCSNLKYIELSGNVTSIGAYAFSVCQYITDVYYNQTGALTDNVSIEKGNTFLTSAAIHYSSKFPNPNIITAECDYATGKYSFNVAVSNVVYYGKLIAVLYDENAICAGTVIADLIPGENQVSVDIDVDVAVDTAKVMIWSSVDSMKPLCEAEKINL